MTETTPSRAGEGASRAIKKTITLPPDIAELAEKRAAADDRTFSSYLRTLVVRDVREHEAANEGEVSK